MSSGTNDVDDTQFMELALEEAFQSEREQRGEPNFPPAVGVVIVKPGAGAIAWAHRSEPPEKNAHAEFMALEKKLAGRRISGAVLYTTLEPCIDVRSHEKEDCAVRVVRSGIQEVVVGMLDPDPRVCAKGVIYLQQNGIRVRRFPKDLEERIRSLNRRFIEAVATRHRVPRLPQKGGPRSLVLTFLDDYTPDPIAVSEFVQALRRQVEAPEIRWSTSHEQLWQLALDERAAVIERLRLQVPGGNVPDLARLDFEHVDNALDLAWKIRIGAASRLPMIWRSFAALAEPRGTRERWFEVATTHFLSLCDARCLQVLYGTQRATTEDELFPQGGLWASWRHEQSRIYADIYRSPERFLRKEVRWVGPEQVAPLMVYGPEQLLRSSRYRLDLDDLVCRKYVLPQVECSFAGKPAELEWNLGGVHWGDLRDDYGRSVDEEP